MPDANGGQTISLQCLNQVGGPQDLTYLAEDVPTVIAHMLRVLPPGLGWGVAGYSEGGFCAANMALRFRYRYGAAASISGYFSPYNNKLATGLVSPFGNNKTLRDNNTPLDEVRALGPGARCRNSGSARVRATDRTWPTPSSSGRNCAISSERAPHPHARHRPQHGDMARRGAADDRMDDEYLGLRCQQSQPDRPGERAARGPETPGRQANCERTTGLRKQGAS